jgi:hypothetical protein
MKAWDFEAVAYDGAIYCVDCLPNGVTTDADDVSPVFAASEWDALPVCLCPPLLPSPHRG